MSDVETENKPMSEEDDDMVIVDEPPSYGGPSDIDEKDLDFDISPPPETEDKPATIQTESSEKNEAETPVVTEQDKSDVSVPSTSTAPEPSHQPLPTKRTVQAAQPKTGTPSEDRPSRSEIKVPLDTLPPSLDYSAYAPRRIEEPGPVRKIYLNLIKTFEGILFIGEIVSSLLTWILLTVWSYAELPVYRMPCPLGFSMFVFVASWVVTTILFVILLTGADGKVDRMKFLREPPFGMACNAIWAIAYLVAGGIAASYAVLDMTQVLGAATAFAFVLLLLHASHALVYFHRRFGKCPWHFLTGCNTECSSSSEK